MQNIKHTILVVAALGGAALCLNVGNAHAEEKLAQQEMQAQIGGAPSPYKIVAGHECCAANTYPCIQHMETVLNGCTRTVHVNHNVCKPKPDVVEEPLHLCKEEKVAQTVACESYIFTKKHVVSYDGQDVWWCSSTEWVLSSQSPVKGCTP